jgi:aarF domain-containing kinase
MSGKRILDALALLGPARNIARKHFEIRLSQLDTYTKTSSIFKGLRTQGPAPLAAAAVGFTSAVSQAAKVTGVNSIPNEAASSDGQGSREGIKQDHFYKRPTENASIDLQPDESLDVRQEKAQRQPLPDGTIPPQDSPLGGDKGDVESFSSRPLAEEPQHPADSAAEGLDVQASARSTIPNPTAQPLSSREARIAQRQSEDQIPGRTADPPEDMGPEFSVDQEQDVFYQPPDSASPVLSALPRMRVPKTENDVQAGDSHIPQGINADVYYSGNKEAETGKAEAEPSEEELAQIFSNPRIAKMLGRKGKYVPDGMQGRSYHTSAVLRQKSAEAEKEDIKKLAEDMAKDAQAPAVSFLLPPSRSEADQLTAVEQCCPGKSLPDA